MDDTQFGKLLQHFNLSRKGYRKVRKGVKKRLRRHMQTLGCSTIDAYINTINASPEDETECKRLLTVPITRFFRDKKLWEVLECDLLPKLLSKTPASFKAWSAGCSGGEEAYSFAIVWQNITEKFTTMPCLQITATDINPECLSRANQGIYPVSSLKEVSDEIKQTFFIKRKKQYQVIETLKNSIAWEKKNLFDTSSTTLFDIIFLRNNLLTYYREPDKSAGFNTIAHCLKQGGILVIGAHESLPKTESDLIRSDRHPLIFTKD